MAKNNLIHYFMIHLERSSSASAQLNKLIYAGRSDLLIILEVEMQHFARQRDLPGSIALYNTINNFGNWITTDQMV